MFRCRRTTTTPSSGSRHSTGKSRSHNEQQPFATYIIYPGRNRGLTRCDRRGTNWYDQAFSEIVLESLDFDFPKPGDPEVKWYCILGGAQQLATKMEAKVNALSGNPNKVEYSSQVTALAQVDAMKVNVDISGGTSNSASGGETRSYSCVFNATALGCLEHMDTTAVSFNSATRQAVRSLGYGPSCKVAIKFTRPEAGVAQKGVENGIE